MTEDMRQLKAFLDALAKDPCDVTTRQVLADWYDDHDEPELAAEQRAFSVVKYRAEQRLRKFADRYASGDYEGMVQGLLEGDYCFSDDDWSEIRYDEQLYEDLAAVTGGDAVEIGDVINNSDGFRCAC